MRLIKSGYIVAGKMSLWTTARYHAAEISSMTGSLCWRPIWFRNQQLKSRTTQPWSIYTSMPGATAEWCHIPTFKPTKRSVKCHLRFWHRLAMPALCCWASNQTDSLCFCVGGCDYIAGVPIYFWVNYGHIKVHSFARWEWGYYRLLLQNIRDIFHNVNGKILN